MLLRQKVIASMKVLAVSAGGKCKEIAKTTKFRWKDHSEIANKVLGARGGPNSCKESEKQSVSKPTNVRT